MGKDYIDLAVDVDRMTGGKELAMKIRETDPGGIPWMAILDGEGNKLVTSDAPKTGNIGCPMQPEERAYFLLMIEKTRQHMTADDVKTIRKAIDTYAADFRAKQERASRERAKRPGL